MKDKKKQYKEISDEILENVGGGENITGVAHCATRLRIVLIDNDKADLKKIENIDLVKGVFIAGDQLQIIFGPGLVNDIFAVFSKLTGIENMSLSDVKSKSSKKQNFLQQAIKSLSDVFIEIMPGILAAALLMGITGLLGQSGLFGEKSVIEMYPALQGINRLLSIISSGIFTILPLLVAYSATKRYGGRPILGLVLGAIMLHPNLADAYEVAKGNVQPEIINFLGLNIELVGFQGGIIIALMMGFLVAKLDKFFIKKVPDMIKLFLAPMLTVFVSSLLLFTIIGPLGRELAQFVTTSLLWTTQNLGIFGYMFFAGIQQIIVITGLHHVLGAVEAQLLIDTGRNFINPLMSVALFGQGGAVLGYVLLHRKNTKVKELGISAFGSVIFGVSEPAIFGVTLRYKFPLIAGCIGGAIAGGYVYLTKLTAIGFGTTALPGLAIVSAENHGHVHYIIAHLIALTLGALFTIVYGYINKQKTEKMSQRLSGDENKKVETAENEASIQIDSNDDSQNIENIATVSEDITSPLIGTVKTLSQVNDEAFSSGAMGPGLAIEPTVGMLYSPVNGVISHVTKTTHAIMITSETGAEILIHIGMDTVKLKGQYFTALVKPGDNVKRNDKLISFDIENIKAAGYDIITPIIITNSDSYKEITHTSKEDVKTNDVLLSLLV